ncbi:hypothetical protein Ahy_A03g012330 isoform A [Arachis hypogaea]|uniref:Pentatricopeptide repeat-containing protein n=1 Tax=Arachis hypogaea TaxID=3818 RepID=A0A445DT29_ARAHY|nr:hypothetical protein Ahy_A03g012330 isoform A [Arachis hypogaea]
MINQCRNIRQLQQVHAYTITTGALPLNPVTILNNILVSLTNLIPNANTCSDSISSLTYALSLFHSIANPNTYSYNNLIRIHTLLSSPSSALYNFVTLRRLSLAPDFHTFPFAIKACSLLPSSSSISIALSLHSQAFKFGFLADPFSLNALICVYSLHRRVHDAHKLFNESSHRDVVSYNAMVHGYSNAKLCYEAIDLFNEMIRLGISPDNIALVNVLSACAQTGELEQGRIVHDYIIRNGIRIDSYLATGLVDLYAKCGCLENARDAFESCNDKDVFTWNAMLIGLAIHGKGSTLLDYFSRMIAAGVKPDGITFLGVLVGCSHAGLVDEARKLFNDMESVYGVGREHKHYGCMADMLGRAGLLEEAVEMIKGMPSGGDVFAWGGLLGGCRIHGNVEVAKKAAQQIMKIKPEDGGVYSVMANIYAHTEQWDDLAKIRRSFGANRRAKKINGLSSVRLDDVN